MKEKLTAAFIIISALLLVFSLATLLNQRRSDLVAVRENVNAVQIANTSVSPASESRPSALTTEESTNHCPAFLRDIDLAALQSKNPDVVGWIDIPGTDVSCPVVQGGDNEVYLRHTWNGKPSRAGAIFLDRQVDPRFEDFNTIIYGHNMRSDIMFSTLDLFAGQDYWAEHPVVYIAAAHGVSCYSIYAAWEAGLKDTAFCLKVERDKDKEAFIEEGLSRSVIYTGVVPTVDDRILTLVTCTDRGKSTRWVVQAVLRE